MLAAPGAGSKPCETTTWELNGMMVWDFGGALSVRPMNKSNLQPIASHFHAHLSAPIKLSSTTWLLQIFYTMDVPDTD